MPRPAKPRAFTLLEISVALALLLLIAALAFPSFSALARDRSDDAARARLDLALAVTRAHARERGDPLVLRAAGRTLQCVRPERSASALAEAGSGPADDLVPERVLDQWVLPDDIRIEPAAPDESGPGAATSASRATPSTSPILLAACLPTGESLPGPAWRLVSPHSFQSATLLAWSGRWSWSEPAPNTGSSSSAAARDEPDANPPDAERPAPDPPTSAEPASNFPDTSLPAAPPVEADPPRPAPKPGARPRRRRSGAARVAPRPRRGSTLLECILALALFVAIGLATLRLADGSGESLRRAHVRARALDLARSSLSRIESSLASAENISGRARTPRGDDEPFEIAATLEPSEFQGLAHAVVRVTHDSGESVTLHQLVPLRREGVP